MHAVDLSSQRAAAPIRIFGSRHAKAFTSSRGPDASAAVRSSSLAPPPLLFRALRPICIGRPEPPPLGWSKRWWDLPPPKACHGHETALLPPGQRRFSLCILRLRGIALKNGVFMRASMVSAALVAALVGYGSTIALVLSAATALGATPAQTTSWLLGVCLAKAVGSAVLSTWHRVPVVLAWSTPGAALIAASQGVTMAQGVGAFLLTAGLIVLTGAVRPLGRLIVMIPDGVAAAMLAGVLLPFCLKGAGAALALPWVILPMVGVFALVRLRSPPFAVLAALVTGVGLALGIGAHVPALVLQAPAPVLIWPQFDVAALLGLGVPLYLVTMASQNLPGFAVLRAAGYIPPVQSALVVTGGISGIAALFGAHTVNMAAITAAICLGDDVHPDRDQRWKVGLFYAGFWVCLGLLGPVILTVLTALPPALVTGIVALALLSPLMGALSGAMAVADTRFAAVVTIVVAGSGVAAFGIGGAFWGLLAGLVVWGMERVAVRRKSHP